MIRSNVLLGDFILSKTLLREFPVFSIYYNGILDDSSSNPNPSGLKIELIKPNHFYVYHNFHHFKNSASLHESEERAGWRS